MVIVMLLHTTMDIISPHMITIILGGIVVVKIKEDDATITVLMQISMAAMNCLVSLEHA